jgi:hypothetical protein
MRTFATQNKFPLLLLTSFLTFSLVGCEAPVGGTGGDPLTANISSGITGLPSIPANVQALGGTSAVVLKWEKSSGGGNITYSVKRSTNEGQGYSVLSSSVTATEFQDKTVTNGTPYYYVVSATNEKGTSADSLQISAVPNAASVAFTSPSTNAFINIANKKAFTIRGTCNPLDSTIRISGVTSASIPCIYGLWAKSFDFSNLADTTNGTVYSIFADVTDPIGVAAPQVSLTLQKGTVSPTATITSPANGAFANQSNVSNFTISGTCSANGRPIVVTAGSGANNITPSIQPVCNVQSTPNWQTTVNLNEANTLVTISAVHTDSAGNSVTSPPVVITKDLGSPSIAITQPIFGSYLNASKNTATFPISGNCDQPNQLVKILVDGVLSTTQQGGVCNGSTFTATIDTRSLSESTHNIYAIISNPAGNTSTSQTVVTKKTTVPQVSVSHPSILGSINISNVTNYILKGSCSENGKQVTLGVNAGTSTILPSPPLCNTSANPNWSTNLNLTGLSDGLVTFNASQIDIASNQTNATPVSVFKKSTPPRITITRPTTNGFINISTNSTNFTVMGTCSEANQQVLLKVNGLAAPSQVGGICNGTNFSSTIDTTVLVEQTHTLVAVLSDVEGNTTTSAVSTLTKNLHSPIVGISTPTATDGVNLTNANDFNVKGYCSIDGTPINVTIRDNSGRNVSSQVNCDSSANPNFAASFNLTTFSDGPILITSTITDNIGNVGSTSRSIPKKTIAPQLAITSLTANQFINKSNNSTSFSISGTCDDSGNSVLILVDYAAAPGQIGGECNGTTFAATFDTTGISDGAHGIVAQLTDSAGNIAKTSNLTVNKDITPPTLSMTVPATNTFINIANNSTAFTVSGSCNGSTEAIRVHVDGSALASQTLGHCDGTAYSTKIDTTEISEGSHNFTAILKDLAGNSATSAVATIVKNTVAPTVAITTPAASSYINTLNDSASFTVSGTCSVNAQLVPVLVDGNTAPGLISGTCNGTTFASKVSTLELSEGTHLFKAVLSDTAGNITTSAGVSVTKATLAPSIGVSSPTDNSYINIATNSANFSISGSCSEASQAITLKVDGSNLASDSTVLCSASGTYGSSMSTLELSEGPHSIVASITSASGNTSLSPTVTFTKDITLPTITLVGPANNSQINAASNSTHFSVHGTCSENNQSITVKVDGSNAAGQASSTCSSGTYATTIDTTGYTDGVHTFTVMINDLAQNSASSASAVVTKKAAIPVIALASPNFLSVMNIANHANFTVSGSCTEDGREVTLNLKVESTPFTPSTQPVCNLNHTPQWQTVVDFSNHPDGNVYFTASQTDFVGNTGTSATFAMTKDTVIPSMAFIKPNSGDFANIANHQAFSVTGNCNENGSHVVLTVTDGITTLNPAPHAYCTLANNPDFTIPVDLSSLNEGSITITSNLTDLSQNKGSPLSVSIFKDSIAPLLAVTTPATDGILVGDLITAAGTCSEDGKPITIKLKGNVTVTETVNCDRSGTPHWVAQLNASGMRDGVLEITASQTDLAENKGTSPIRFVNRNTVPVITPVANQVYPLNEENFPPLIQGQTATLTSTVSSSGNVNSFSNCTYETVGLSVSDPNYASPGTACNLLPSLKTVNGITVAGKASFSSTSGTIGTGTVTWTPTSTQRGTYKFTLTATNNNNSINETFYATVRESYSTHNLVGALDASISADNADLPGIPVRPRSNFNTNNDQSTWIGMLNSFFGSLASFGTSAPGVGTGAASLASVDPYAVSFNASNSDRVSIGSVLAEARRIAVSMWISPSSSLTKGSVIASNADNQGNGFILRQSVSVPGSLELLGNYRTLVDEVLSDSPVAYYRLNESSANAGATAYDLTSHLNHGTYTNTQAPQSAGALTGDSDSAITLSGSAGFISIADTASLNPTTAFTAEAFVKTSNANEQYILSKGDDSFLLATGVSGDGAVCFKLNGVSTDFTCGTQAINNNAWHHVAATYDGSNIQIYVDGVLNITAPHTGTISSGTSSVAIGARPGHTGSHYFAGSLDEVAVYGSALSQARIQAHYNARSKVVCRSSTLLSNNSYVHVSGLFNGATTQLLVNGRNECRNTTASSYSYSTADVVIGSSPAGTQAWSGKISDIKVFGSFSTTPVTPASLFNDFTATANRYRNVPVENILTEGLVMNLDAANAKQGLSAYSTGCSISDLNFTNLANTTITAQLNGFSACGEGLGWQGTGASASPYALSFNGLTHSVAVNSISSSGLSRVTFAGWIRPGSFVNNLNSLFSTNTGSVAVSINNAGKLVFSMPNNFPVNMTSTSALSANTWSHVALVYDNIAQQLSIYINGTLDSEQTYGVVQPAVLGAAQIGAAAGESRFFQGKLGTFSIYNKGLSIEEVKQNCLAQQGRFGVTGCAN